MAEEKLTVTVHEAAELLGVSAWSVYERIKADDFSHFRVGRRILIPRDAIDAQCKPGAATPVDLEAVAALRLRLDEAQDALALLADAIDGVLKSAR